MRANLTCHLGHVFDADANAAALGTSCPECGSPVRLIESETPPKEWMQNLGRSVGTEAVLIPSYRERVGALRIQLNRPAVMLVS